MHKTASILVVLAVLFAALLAACESNARALQLIEEHKCLECHMLKGKGGAVGPSLTNVGGRRDREYIYQQIKDPKSHNPRTAMPSFGDRLSEQDLDILTDFLAGRK
jgi:mono/diheme cytochrome c family protein